MFTGDHDNNKPDETIQKGLLYTYTVHIEYKSMARIWKTVMFVLFFSVRRLSVLRGHSFFSSPPQQPMTSDFEGFSILDFIHYIYFPILILEKEPVFPF